MPQAVHLHGVPHGARAMREAMHVHRLQDGGRNPHQASSVHGVQAGPLHADGPSEALRAEASGLHGDPLRAEDGLPRSPRDGLLPGAELLLPDLVLRRLVV